MLSDEGQKQSQTNPKRTQFIRTALCVKRIANGILKNKANPD
jgi:hypothetical protein